MPSQATSIDGGPYPSQTLFIMGSAAFLCVFVCAFMAWTLHLWFMYPAAVLCFAAALGSAAHWRIIVDRTAGTVTRESRLFGKWRLFSTRRATADFAAISFRRVDRDTVEPTCETVWVGLIRHDGRFWQVGYFGAGELHPSASADHLALELAEATGLEIRGKGADPSSPVAPSRGGRWYYPLSKPRNYRFPRRDL